MLPRYLPVCIWRIHDDVINSKKIRVTCPFCGEFIGHWYIPLIKASDANFGVSLICAWTSGWVKSRNAVDLRRHRTSFSRHCNAMILHRKSIFLNIELETCVAPKSLFLFSNWSNEVNRKKSIAYLLIILNPHFQSIFLEKILVVMSSLKFVRKRSIYNMQALV